MTTSRPIYMDHNATTPVLPEVVEAMLPYYTEEFGNPSSTTHVFGSRAAEAVTRARRSLARLIGATRPEEIVFTAGATESDNMALHGVCHARREHGDHIITSAIEHEAILEPCEALETIGVRTTVLPVGRDGRVDPQVVAEAMTDRTILVSVMMANNEIGTIQPLEAIGRLCREKKVLLHSDAVQAAGRIPIDVEHLGVGLMSLTAHKMYGPKGVGALYVRQGVELEPLLRGGGQEASIRSGTLNVPAIVGFGAAAEAAMRDMTEESARQRRLLDRLWEGIRERIEDVTPNGSLEHRLPNTLNVAFAGVDAEAVVTALRETAALSTGSACASGEETGSYVIRALYHGSEAEAYARSSVRFGLGRDNSEQEIDQVIEDLARAVERLRAMAPRESIEHRAS